MDEFQQHWDAPPNPALEMSNSAGSGQDVRRNINGELAWRKDFDRIRQAVDGLSEDMHWAQAPGRTPEERCFDPMSKLPPSIRAMAVKPMLPPAPPQPLQSLKPNQPLPVPPPQPQEPGRSSASMESTLLASHRNGKERDEMERVEGELDTARLAQDVSNVSESSDLYSLHVEKYTAMTANPANHAKGEGTDCKAEGTNEEYSPTSIAHESTAYESQPHFAEIPRALTLPLPGPAASWMSPGLLLHGEPSAASRLPPLVALQPVLDHNDPSHYYFNTDYGPPLRSVTFEEMRFHGLVANKGPCPNPMVMALANALAHQRLTEQLTGLTGVKSIRSFEPIPDAGRRGADACESLRHSHREDTQK